MKNYSLYRINDDLASSEGASLAFERAFPKVGAFSHMISHFVRPNCIKNLLCDTLHRRDFVP
jgi:hypothetical protein